jgi:PAS domain S-box-containing protein
MGTEEFYTRVMAASETPDDSAFAVIARRIELANSNASGVGTESRYRGHIILVVSLDILAQQVANTSISDTGFIFYSDAKGQLLTDVSGYSNFTSEQRQQIQQAAENHSVSDSVFNLEESVSNWEDSVSNWEDPEGYFYHKKVHDNLHLFGYFQSSEVFTDGHNIVAFGIIIIILSTLLMVFILYVTMNRFIFKPLEMLMSGIKSVPKEAFGHQIPVVSNDELGELSHLYNEMIQQLKESSVSKKFMSDILTDMREAVMVTDAKGKILFANKKLQSLLRYDEPELLANSVFVLLAEETRKKLSYRNEIDAVDVAVPQDLEGTEWFLTKEGQSIPVMLSVNSITTTLGKRNLVICAADLTQRIAQENEVVEAKQIAEQANQAKTEFLSRMSHELRTPLNAIIGFSQLQLMFTNLDEETKKNIEYIHEAGQHLLLLVNDVLDIAMLEQNRINISLENCSLKKALSESLKFVEALANEKSVELIDAAEDIWVVAQHSRIVQVLVNLLSNAIKYNVDSGKVTITTATEGKYSVINITDTGIGINTKNIQDIFEPFNRLTFTDSELVEGTGLGLTLTKYLVERMNGSIFVSSQQGAGTTVSLRFPSTDNQLTQNAEYHPLVLPGVDQQKTSKAIKMLYIEDNASSQLLVKAIAKKMSNAEVYTANSGEEGISFAATLVPDIILIDINLPGISGTETLLRLRANKSLSHCKFVALSADASAGTIEHALNMGFSEYLVKPLELEHFMKILDQQGS